MSKNVYSKIIELVFLKKFREGDIEVNFERSELIDAAVELNLPRPKNVGDVIYTFRSRQELPESIAQKAPRGTEWIISSLGPGKYAFSARIPLNHSIDRERVTMVPDCTPPLVAMYATSDEQALLSQVRYCRLIDIFTGVTCFSLQSHLRTSVPKIGQIETDEIYIGIDREGSKFVIPVQAKGIKDFLSLVQIEQDISMCSSKFPDLECRAVGIKRDTNDIISMFEYTTRDNEVSIERRASFTIHRL